MARTCVFSPVNPSSTHSKSFFCVFLSLLPKLRLLGLFYNPTNPIFQHFSLILATVILPFPCLVVLFLPISIFLSCLCLSLSLSLSPSHHHFSLSLSITLFQYISSPFSFLFFFFVFSTLLGAWCLGGEKTWDSKGKYIYIFLFWYVL